MVAAATRTCLQHVGCTRPSKGVGHCRSCASLNDAIACDGMIQGTPTCAPSQPLALHRHHQIRHVPCDTRHLSCVCAPSSLLREHVANVVSIKFFTQAFKG
eukprot:349759-Chlamydomonas_euryale.AAC.5